MGKKHKIHGHHIIENHNGVRVKTDKIIEVTPEEHHKIHKEYYEKSLTRIKELSEEK